MGKVISISIQKGGTGKTTVCRNLGEGVAKAGGRVLFIDNDPQGNLSSYVFGDKLPEEIMTITESVTSGLKKAMPGVCNAYWFYQESEIPSPYKVNDNLYIIGATKHLAEVNSKGVNCIYEFIEKVAKLATEFDHIFIDCPPAAGTLQSAAHGASDFVLIPTELSEDSIDGIEQQIESLAANKEHINKKLSLLGVLVNKKETHKINIEEYYADIVQSKYGAKVFNTMITKSVKVSEARAYNQTVQDYSGKSPQALQYTSLVQEYLERVGV